MKLMVDIYRSTKKEGMYLYLKRGENMDTLPEELKTGFGKAEHAMTLLLTPDRKLARVKVETVVDAIEKSGFYLQLPPSADGYMQKIDNDKLTSRPL